MSWCDLDFTFDLSVVTLRWKILSMLSTVSGWVGGGGNKFVRAVSQKVECIGS